VVQVPPNGLLRFQRDEARSRALRGEVVGRANAGNAGAGDQDVEMLVCGATSCRSGFERSSSLFFFRLFVSESETPEPEVLAP
jgi:hypothetical protein